MKSPRLLTILYILVCMVSCQSAGNGKAPGNDTTSGVLEPVHSAAESALTESLLRLAFVEKADRYIDSFTEHTQRLSFMTDTTAGMVHITAGYNGPDRFETYFHFTVNLQTSELRVMDPASGEYLTVSEFSKRNRE